MNKYQNGKIYKIVCNITNDVYIGSTVRTLEKRLISHKSSCRNDKRKCSSHTIIERGDYKIELIELHPCETNLQLEQREGYYQRNIKCINKYLTGRTRKEYSKLWRTENKEILKVKQKEYYENNKDVFKAKSKIYYNSNKEQFHKKSAEWYKLHKNDDDVKLKQKQYRDAHKEEQKILNKEWREKNKDIIKQKKKEKYLRTKHLKKPALTCECGGTYEDSISKKKRHESTKKHISFYSNN
mgnify:CR=1 FL=1